MPLRVIAAAIVEPRGLLLVSKRAAPRVFYLPGGKPDPGESQLACLRREVREELGIALTDIEPFADVRAPAALEGVEMLMSVFRARALGEPQPAAEIASLLWWPDGSDVTLAPAVEDRVIPELRRRGIVQTDVPRAGERVLRVSGTRTTIAPMPHARRT